MEETKEKIESMNDMSSKLSEKWLSATAGTIVDIYNKQLLFTSKFYNSYMNSLFSYGKTQSEGQNASNMFSNPDLVKWPGGTATANKDSETKANPFFITMDEVLKKVLEYNHHFLAKLQNLRANQIDWRSVNAEYFNYLETQIETIKKTASSMSEVYNQQINNSFDANHKLREEMNNRLTAIFQQNQKIMAEFFISQQWNNKSNSGNFSTQGKSEEKKSKDANPSTDKKKIEIPVM